MVRRLLCPRTDVIELPSTASAAIKSPCSLSGVDERRRIGSGLSLARRFRVMFGLAWNNGSVRVTGSVASNELQIVARAKAGEGAISGASPGRLLAFEPGVLSASVAISANSSRTLRAGVSGTTRRELEMGETRVDCGGLLDPPALIFP